MNIRLANWDDLTQIVAIYEETFKDTLRNPIRYYSKYIKTRNIMVIAKNGIVCGVYVWEINRMKNILDRKQGTGSPCMWLRQVMVEIKNQGYGLGSQLMLDFLMKKEIEKRLVCKDKLVNWYERFGFLCEQVVYYKKSKLNLMVKE